MLPPFVRSAHADCRCNASPPYWARDRKTFIKVYLPPLALKGPISHLVALGDSLGVESLPCRAMQLVPGFEECALP